MAEQLTITTIPKYFSGVINLNKDIKTRLFSYKFPSAICLNSSYSDETLLGTLNFSELDGSNYPTYSGDVVKAGLDSNTYTTTVSYRGRWIFTLEPKSGGTTIIITSQITNSKNPTKVDYVEISRPTAGACEIGIG